MENSGAIRVPPEIAAIFSQEAHLRALLAFEAALARAQARAGLVPEEAARAIVAACRLEDGDVAAIAAEAARAGTPVVPLVRMLRARTGGAAAGYIHFGATSQDAIDTAFALQAREGLRWLDARLAALGDSCAVLAERHRRTLMAGRTLLQQALPISFGLKAARWLALVTRQRQRLHAARDEACVLQFGGAVGTLAAFGTAGPRVTALLAEEVGLTAPDLPWHAERDRIAALAAALGITAGAMAKIAGDLVLLAQSEVDEVAEGEAPGKGISSAMPQKQNPVDAVFAIAAAKPAANEAAFLLTNLMHEHERAAGAWQAEWEVLPRLFCYTVAAVDRVCDAVGGLRVDAARMRAALDSNDAIMAEALAVALAPGMGLPAAQEIVAGLCREARARCRSLREVALEDERVRVHLSAADVERALQPENYLGSAETFIDRALAGHRALAQGRHD